MADTYDPALYQSPIYRAWSNMKTRCYNESVPCFARYGARGITVCDEWQTFAGFLSDMGPSYRQGLTLDRRDNNKGYSTDNCRWVDRTVQANNRRSNRLVCIDGETKTLEQWIMARGLKSSTVRQRIYGLKWTVERSLELEA